LLKKSQISHFCSDAVAVDFWNSYPSTSYLVYSATGDALALFTPDFMVRVYDTSSFRIISEFGYFNSLSCRPTFQPSSALIAVSCNNSIIFLNSSSAMGNLAGYFFSNNLSSYIAYNPRGGQIASIDYNTNGVVVWSNFTFPALRYKASLAQSPKATLTSVTCHPRGTLLVGSVSSDRSVRVWDTITGNIYGTLSEHTDYVTSVAVSPAGDQFASGSFDRTVKLWSLASLASPSLVTLRGNAPVTCVKYNPQNSKQLASASEDRTIVLWDVSSFSQITTLRHTGAVRTLAYRFDGKQLASGADDGTIKLWDTSSFSVIATLGLMGSSAISAICFSPSGDQLASGDNFGRILLWDPANLEKIILPDLRGKVTTIMFGPAASQLVSTSEAGAIRFWSNVSSSQSYVEQFYAQDYQDRALVADCFVPEK
jgi:WD40 repeat protein